MTTQPIDYAALAKQAGGASLPPSPPAAGIPPSEASVQPVVSPASAAPIAGAGPRPAHEFASTQVNLPELMANLIRAAAAMIPDSQIHTEDGAPMASGLESEPHITVKYGLEGDDPAAVAKLIEGERPVVAKLGKTSLFRNDDADVLKLDIESPGLRRLNQKVGSLPNADEHPKYRPHVTIGAPVAG